MSFQFTKFGEVQEYISGKPHNSPRQPTDLEEQQRDEIKQLNEEIVRLEKEIYRLEELADYSKQ